MVPRVIKSLPCGVNLRTVWLPSSEQYSVPSGATVIPCVSRGNWPWPLAPRRVEIALVVDVGHARLQGIARDETHFAGLVRAGGLDDRPVAHHGLSPGLTVDRPGRTVVVRIALFGVLVDVGEDAEAELRVLVENLALGHVVADMSGEERLVLQDIVDDLAHLLPAPGAGIVREGALTGGRELLQRPAHGMTTWPSASITSRAASRMRPIAAMRPCRTATSAR